MPNHRATASATPAGGSPARSTWIGLRPVQVNREWEWGEGGVGVGGEVEGGVAGEVEGQD